MSRAFETSSSTHTSTAGATSISVSRKRSPSSALKKKGIQPSAISGVCSIAFGPIAPR
jgi:hypothetical protein